MDGQAELADPSPDWMVLFEDPPGFHRPLVPKEIRQVWILHRDLAGNAVAIETIEGLVGGELGEPLLQEGGELVVLEVGR